MSIRCDGVGRENRPRRGRGGGGFIPVEGGFGGGRARGDVSDATVVLPGAPGGSWVASSRSTARVRRWRSFITVMMALLMPAGGAAARGGDERVEGLVVVSAITSQVPGAKTE